jgi:hypothetical protein
VYISGSSKGGFFLSGNILHRKPSRYTCGDATLVESDSVNWGIVGASRWVQVSPLGMFAQVGAVCNGEGRGGESDCSDLAHQLDWPMTPGGRSGRVGRGERCHINTGAL